MSSVQLKDGVEARLLLRYKMKNDGTGVCCEAAHRVLLQESSGLLCGDIGFSICIIPEKKLCASRAIRVLSSFVCA